MKCDIEGLDSIIDDLKAIEEDTEAIAEEMLEAAGEVMEEAWKEEVTRRKFILSGSMRDSVKSKVLLKKRYVETYPQKKDKKGTSNATKAFVLHHGRGKGGSKGAIRATYFVNDIQEQGGAKAQVAMRDVLDKHLKEKGM